MSENEHGTAIRTPKQLVAAIAGFFLVTVIGIILLVKYVATEPLSGAGSDAMRPEKVAERLRPIAAQGFRLQAAGGAKQLQTGEAVYNGVCVACHGTGAAGAPKLGDNAAWTARIGQGYDTLLKHSIEGIRAMPAKGGKADLDNLEVARAVAFMANKSGASFKEPAAPAAAK